MGAGAFAARWARSLRGGAPGSLRGALRIPLRRKGRGPSLRGRGPRPRPYFSRPARRRFRLSCLAVGRVSLLLGLRPRRGAPPGRRGAALRRASPRRGAARLRGCGPCAPWALRRPGSRPLRGPLPPGSGALRHPGPRALFPGSFLSRTPGILKEARTASFSAAAEAQKRPSRAFPGGGDKVSHASSPKNGPEGLFRLIAARSCGPDRSASSSCPANQSAAAPPGSAPRPTGRA